MTMNSKHNYASSWRGTQKLLLFISEVYNMGTKSLVSIKDHSREHVVSFFVDCYVPEGHAWSALIEWQ